MPGNGWQLAQNDINPFSRYSNEPGGPFLHWYYDQLKGGLKQRQQQHRCAVSNISPSEVETAAGEHGMSGAVSALTLSIVGGFLTEGIADIAALGEIAIHATTESGTEAAAAAGASAISQACSG